MNSELVIHLTIAVCVGFLSGVAASAVILLYISRKYRQEANQETSQ